MAQPMDLEKVLAETNGKYDQVVLDTSVIRWNGSHFDGRGSFRAIVAYKEKLLQSIETLGNLTVTETVYNELEKGIKVLQSDYKIGPNRETLLRYEKQALWHLKRRVIKPFSRDGGFMALRKESSYVKDKFRIGENDYDVLSELLFHAISNPDKNFAFLTNDRMMARALDYCRHRSKQKNIDIYTYIAGQFSHYNPLCSGSLQDLAVLSAPKQQVELIHVNANVS